MSFWGSIIGGALGGLGGLLGSQSGQPGSGQRGYQHSTSFAEYPDWARERIFEQNPWDFYQQTPAFMAPAVRQGMGLMAGGPQMAPQSFGGILDQLNNPYGGGGGGSMGGFPGASPYGGSMGGFPGASPYGGSMGSQQQQQNGLMGLLGFGQQAPYALLANNPMYGSNIAETPNNMAGQRYPGTEAWQEEDTNQPHPAQTYGGGPWY